jgi:hypothetical protein
MKLSQPYQKELLALVFGFVVIAGVIFFPVSASAESVYLGDYSVGKSVDTNSLLDSICSVAGSTIQFYFAGNGSGDGSAGSSENYTAAVSCASIPRDQAWEYYFSSVYSNCSNNSWCSTGHDHLFLILPSGYTCDPALTYMDCAGQAIRHGSVEFLWSDRSAEAMTRLEPMTLPTGAQNYDSAAITGNCGDNEQWGIFNPQISGYNGIASMETCEGAHATWRSYMEGLPQVYPPPVSGNYIVAEVPYVFQEQLNLDPTCYDSNTGQNKYIGACRALLGAISTITFSSATPTPPAIPVGGSQFGSGNAKAIFSNMGANISSMINTSLTWILGMLGVLLGLGYAINALIKYITGKPTMLGGFAMGDRSGSAIKRRNKEIQGELDRYRQKVDMMS